MLLLGFFLTQRRDDDEDETIALMRELEKIKKERAAAKAKEVGGSRSVSRSLFCADNLFIGG